MRLRIVLLLTVLAIGCSASSPTAPTAPGPQVVAPTRTRVSLTLAAPDKVSMGEIGQAKAELLWSDGTKEDITPSVPWKSSFPNVASIDESGRITGRKSGDTQIYLENYEGKNPAVPHRTVIEGSQAFALDLEIVAPQNGATLRLAGLNADLSDRLMVMTGSLPGEWLSSNPTARLWVCFKNKPSFWIVGACASAPASSARQFRPYLSALNEYHRSVGETYEVALFLTVGVDEKTFYHLSATGDPYQLPDNDPAIVWSVTKPLRVSHR